MGNGTKVALVALLVLMVVVIARFVRNESGPETVPPPKDGAQLARVPTGKVPATDAGNAASTASRAPAPRTPQTGAAATSRGPQAGTRSGPVTGAASGRTTTLGSANVPGAALSRGREPATTGGAGSGEVGGVGGSGSVGSDADPTARVFIGPRRPTPGAPLVDSSIPGDLPPGAASAGSSEPGGSAGSLLAQGDRGLPPSSIRGEAAGEDKGGAGTPDQGTPRPAAFHGPAGPRLGPDGDRPTPVAIDQDRTLNPDSEPKKSYEPIPPPPAPPADGYPKTHKVEKLESYWRLAERYYGKGWLWPHIEKANPGVKLIPEKTITIPAPPPEVAAPPKAPQGPKAEAPKAEPPKAEAPKAPSGQQTYIVREKDTLWGLATRFYGDHRKMDLIREANTDLRYGGELIAGKSIVIPSAR